MTLSSQIEPSINVDYVSKLMGHFSERGISEAEVFAAMPDLQSDMKSGWVRARNVNQLYCYGGEQLSDPHLGLRFGNQLTAKSFMIVGYLAISAPDVLSALRTTCCFQGIYSRIGKMVIRENENVMMCWDATWPRELMSHHAVEASIASWHRVGLTMLSDGYYADGILFQHEQQGELAVYEEIFGCPVLFNQEYDAICLRKEDLEKEVNLADDMVHDALLQKSQQILATLGRDSLIDKIEQTLKAEGEGVLLPIEYIADHLNMKSQELSKQLKKSGLSYRTLLDRAKFIESLPYLIDESQEFVDVAQILGFSEQSSFTRAFKRWTDLSPLAYRNVLKSLDCV